MFQVEIYGRVRRGVRVEGRSQRAVAKEFGERFERDHAAMLPLPAAPYEACEKIAGRVSSLSLVRYRLNDYSVPTEYGHRQVWVKGSGFSIRPDQPVPNATQGHCTASPNVRQNPHSIKATPEGDPGYV
jgi:hypothetical protein